MPLQKLVVDANAFIKAYALQELCAQVYTIPDVIREIRDSATRHRLKCIPYQLILEEPRADFVTRATELGKRTGDYASLSLVDIKLIALAMQFHEEEEPVLFKDASVRTVFGSGQSGAQQPSSTLPMGFHMPQLELAKYEAHLATRSYVQGFSLSHKDTELLRRLDGVPLGDLVHLKRWSEHVTAVLAVGLHPAPPPPALHEEDSGCEESEETSSEEEDSDDGGWITASNYKAKPQSVLSASVAVLSTDFAIQNVILHTNMALVSGQGERITTLRSYILRCYACFFTTPQFEKKFCPRCGNSTLRKVSVSVGEDGEMKLHFSRKFVVSARGKKFSLPSPQGGKHAVNPILTQDQQIPQEKRSKKALARESGPFEMNDINSRAFFVKTSSAHYWDSCNPNQVKGKGRKKR